MSAPTAALAAFRTNNENVTYEILRVDAYGVGQGYSSGGWNLDEANEVKTEMEKAPWNQDMTFHIVKKAVATTYELV